MGKQTPQNNSFQATNPTAPQFANQPKPNFNAQTAATPAANEQNLRASPSAGGGFLGAISQAASPMAQLASQAMAARTQDSRQASQAGLNSISDQRERITSLLSALRGAGARSRGSFRPPTSPAQFAATANRFTPRPS